MGGGLMQLLSMGAQDVYLTRNIGFRIYYKKHIIDDIVVKIEITGWEFVEYIRISNNTKNCYYPNIIIDKKNMFNFLFDAIDCSKNYLKKLPRFSNYDDFAKLKYFNCSTNCLTNINKLKYINLIRLDCSYNQIKTIPEKMFSLEYFDFSNNYVNEEVDFINYPKLKYLLASSNQIKKISNLQNELVYLDLSNNPIYDNQLTNLPDSLIYLLIVKTRVKNINLTNLTNLKYLDVSINNLDGLDGLPNGLLYLNCSQCAINILDNLPNTITNLICINNNIKSLNMLPESLCYLDCDHNQITKLNDLPHKLIELTCSNNQLTGLDNLPPNLKYLDYSDNKLLLELDSNGNTKIKLNLPKSLKKIVSTKKDIKKDGPEVTFF